MGTLAIYTRLSREDEDSTSIHNQTREGIEFAKNNGFDDYEIFNEGEGVSGTLDWTDRVELSRLIRDISENKFDAVWFRNQNRLGRAMDTHVAFVKACLKNKTKVFFEDKQWDYTDATEDLIGNVLSSLNTYTAKLQSQQTKKALLDNVKQGRAHSVIAYGYTTDDDRCLIIDESEAHIVRKMFADHIEGKGCSTIAEDLNIKGVPTRYSKLKNKTSGKWHDKTVRGILRNTIYYGKRQWAGNEYDAPSIVSKIVWDKSIKAFDNNQNGGGKKVEHKYLLNGLIICGVCGRRMLGRRRVSGKDNAYTCAGKRLKGDEKCSNRSINIDAMEDFVWTRFFVEQRFIEKVKESVEANKDTSKYQMLVDSINDIDGQMAALDKQKKNAIRLVISGVLSDDDVKSELKVLAGQKDVLVEQKNRIDEELEFIRAVEKQHETVKNHISDLKNDTPFNIKREIIHKYIKKIEINVIGTTDHILWLSFNMPVEEETYMRVKGVFSVFDNDTADLKPFQQSHI